MSTQINMKVTKANLKYAKVNLKSLVNYNWVRSVVLDCSQDIYKKITEHVDSRNVKKITPSGDPVSAKCKWLVELEPSFFILQEAGELVDSMRKYYNDVIKNSVNKIILPVTILSTHEGRAVTVDTSTELDFINQDVDSDVSNKLEGKTLVLDLHVDSKVSKKIKEGKYDKSSLVLPWNVRNFLTDEAKK